MQSDSYPLFSVIIPQKNRAEYLVHTLRTCMLQDYPNFQVIVSDDFSDDNSVEIARQMAKIDSRIKVFAHDHHLGMRDNFEFALSRVETGYVMALGGDDGLVPGCITRMYEIIKETGRQLLTWVPASFTYSDEEEGDNIFLVKRKKYTGVKFIKSGDFLNKIAKTLWYQVDECPMFYIKGVASVELVNKVKSRTKDGCFYYCPTPDGFSGVVLAGEVDDYAFTNEPLSIGGTTSKSQGANYMRTDEKSRREAEQFFNDNVRRTMHPELASQQYSPIQTLMTADYLLTARDLPGWPGKFEMFQFEDLLKVTFQILQKHSMRNEVLKRELLILRQIAIQHNCLPLFDDLMKNTKRKVVREPNVYGFAITNSIRFNGHAIGIDNIFDASLAVNFIYNCYGRFSLRTFSRIFVNNIKIVARTKQYKKENMPLLENTVV